MKSTAAEPPPSDASFDPYGRLLRMLMPSLRGVVVHDGFSNLVWASDEWDLSDEPDLIKDAIANALSDAAEFPDVVRTLDADRVVYSFAVRGEHIELLGVVSLIARLSGTQTASRGRCRPCGSWCSRRSNACGANWRCARSWARASAISTCASAIWISCWRCPRISRRPASDADEFGLILKTGLERMGCALAALWVPDKNIALSLDAQRPADVAGIAEARAAASDGVDAAAAAHHRGQPHFQGRERRGGALQDPGLPGAASVRAGHGRARPVQSAERAGLRSASNAHRRDAGQDAPPTSSRRNTIPAPAS